MCKPMNGKRANVVRVSRNRKNVMFSCPCSSFVVLCFDCHTSPFETLVLFVMNHGERERCRANFVNTCSNCSRSSVHNFRVSANRLDSIIGDSKISENTLREREDSNSNTLFSKDCSLGSPI